MRIVQINAIYGRKSTGTIVREIQTISEECGFEAYVVYSIADGRCFNKPKGYHIGNKLTAKIAALLSRIIGKQAYVNHFTTYLLLHWLDRIKPDIVHLHNLHSNYIHLNMLLRYLSRRNIATVITLHDCWFFTGGCMHYASIGCERWKKGCGQCPKRKLIPSFFLDNTAAVLRDRKRYLSSIPRLTMVGASEWIAKELHNSQLKNLRITFIHNGFDLALFTPRITGKRSELQLDEKFVILGPAVKWLLPINKHTLDFFIANMESDMVLVLFGYSGDVLSLPLNVIILGYSKNPNEMAELYSMADVMVNCSREDTLSSINIECQACGTPVVTYDATGNKETVGQESGFVVPTGDAKSLFESVMTIKRRGKNYYSKQCQIWVQTNFDKRINYQKYIDLYNEIV